MTQTDRLRAMLDERGVEWTKPSGLNERYANELTFIGDHAVVSGIDGSDLLRINFDGTPEQAIAATLGAGTCRWEYPQGANGWLGYMVCSGCGEKFDECVTDTAHYCPNCGRRVVDE